MSESSKVQPAKLSWREDELGNLVPVSEVFGDVYYSLADGLAESRYVFLEQNQLPERFAALFKQSLLGGTASKDTIEDTCSEALFKDHQAIITADNFRTSPTFTIAELGFGTGLNILATWQLWQQSKQAVYAEQGNRDNTQKNSLLPRLHLISTEKHPLTLADLTRSLKSWQDKDPALAPLIKRLLSLYPTLVSGCHRLHLADDVTLDLWLGDATDSLQKLASLDPHSPFLLSSTQQPQINAWYLDGFAPSCNESLWVEQIFEQVQRLSLPGTTAATFSCAGVVKRGLMTAGFEIKKTKGFGRKREMLTAKKLMDIPEAVNKVEGSDGFDSIDNADSPYSNNNIKGSISNEGQSSANIRAQEQKCYRKIAVIGAGVSGLMAAWSLAQRGIQVCLIDKAAPLAGASGNPRGLLAPKMTPIAHVAEHLHSIGYLYSQRLYRQLDEHNQQLCKAKQKSLTTPPSPIFTATATLDLLFKSNVDESQIAEYPAQMATTLPAQQAQNISGLQHLDLTQNLYLPQAGLVNPKALADTILHHPNIYFKQADIQHVRTHQSPDNKDTWVQLETTSADFDKAELTKFDAVIIAAAFDSQRLDSRIFEFRKIRGQLSWLIPSADQIKSLPKLPLKYGGYCAMFTPCGTDDQLNPVSVDTPTFLLGASFVRNDINTDIRGSEHQVNLDKLVKALPELEEVLQPDFKRTNTDIEAETYQGWQARVGIRAQTPDYHPLVGPLDAEGLIWTLSGMGSKGYAFAPLCAEVLADMMTGQFTPLPRSLLARLSPQRSSLQKPLTK